MTDLVSFLMQMSVGQPSVLKVTSSVIEVRSGVFGWHKIIFFKVLRSDVFVTID